MSDKVKVSLVLKDGPCRQKDILFYLFQLHEVSCVSLKEKESFWGQLIVFVTKGTTIPKRRASTVCLCVSIESGLL